MFLGCLLYVFGPLLAIFGFFVAKKSQNIILAMGAYVGIILPSRDDIFVVFVLMDIAMTVSPYMKVIKACNRESLTNSLCFLDYGSSFVWTIAILLSSSWWMIVKPLRGVFPFIIPFSVLFQEISRYAIWKLY